MKSGRKHVFQSGTVRRIWGAALSVAVALSLAACGKSSSGEVQGKEWRWVPEFVDMGEENVSYYDMRMVGDALCYQSSEWEEKGDGEEVYVQNICKYSPADGSVAKTPLTLPEEGNSSYMNVFDIAGDGSIYGVLSEWGGESGKPSHSLVKFDAKGKSQFSKDLTELVGDGYVNRMMLDGQGRVYITGGDGEIWLFDSEGNHKGAVAVPGGGWINGMGCGKDGKMYICYYNNGYILGEVDFDGKAIGATYENFPAGGEKLMPGIEKDFLIQDGSRIYEYDLKTKTKEEVLTWLDSDISGTSVQEFGILSDGRILAVLNDWESGEKGIALLKKTEASEVPQKETVTIACLYSNYMLPPLAVKFNKTNEKYRISIKTYVDDSYSGDDYQAMMADAIQRLNSDITSSNSPDIIDLTGLNMRQLASKGVFEDLNGYLEKSGKLARADFLENIIASYEIGGKLAGIPSTFQMVTVAGKASELGDKTGWTLEELIAYADAHPGKELFDDTPKEQIMMYLMLYNEDAFIDWSTGKCSYDSPEFKSLLEFVNRFPDEVQYGDPVSTPNRIQRGEVLLYEANFYDFNQAQVCDAIFQGDVSYIGYPTTDGSKGCMLTANQAYAIAAKSKHKDGAWEFIESFLTREEKSGDGRMRIDGFSTRKSVLEAQAAEAVKVEYILDENGEKILDENGEPIVAGGDSSFSYEDGWSYEYRTPTQEEVDLAMSLIKAAKPVYYTYGDEVQKIISEEAAAYYKGQKTVDEVASVIQSRVKIYVDTNK